MNHQRNIAAAFLIFFSLLARPVQAQLNQAEAKPSPIRLELTFVRAWDPRFPRPSDSDLEIALEAARSQLDRSFGMPVLIEYRDAGTIALDELFRSTAYRDSESYRETARWKMGTEGPDAFLEDEEYRERALRFLERRWSLESLAGILPDGTAESYSEVLTILLHTLSERKRSLRGLCAPDGTPALPEPLPPWQSAVEWKHLLGTQANYDIILTNTLILEDDLVECFPHSVTRHGKISGMAVQNDARSAMDGRAVMASAIEEFGDLDGIGNDQRLLPSGRRAEIFGGFLLAHELGHAIFGLPDVYDHGPGCLMDSGKAFTHREGFAVLQVAPNPCRECLEFAVLRTAKLLYGSHLDAPQPSANMQEIGPWMASILGPADSRWADQCILGTPDLDSASVNDFTPLQWAAWTSEDPSVLKKLCGAGARADFSAKLHLTPLQIAAMFNPNPDIARALLEAGADPDCLGELEASPLFLALAFNPNSKVAELLLESGADPSVLKEYWQDIRKYRDQDFEFLCSNFRLNVESKIPPRPEEFKDIPLVLGNLVRDIESPLRTGIDLRISPSRGHGYLRKKDGSTGQYSLHYLSVNAVQGTYVLRTWMPENLNAKLAVIEQIEYHKHYDDLSLPGSNFTLRFVLLKYPREGDPDKKSELLPLPMDRIEISVFSSSQQIGPSMFRPSFISYLVPVEGLPELLRHLEELVGQAILRGSSP